MSSRGLDIVTEAIPSPRLLHHLCPEPEDAFCGIETLRQIVIVAFCGIQTGASGEFLLTRPDFRVEHIVFWMVKSMNRQGPLVIGRHGITVVFCKGDSGSEAARSVSSAGPYG